MKSGLRLLCWTYTALLILGAAIGLIIGFTTVYGDRSGMGCNFYDALLYGIECRGFIGTKFIEFLVGFPLLVGQLSAIALSSPTFLLLALPSWLPVFFSLYWVLRPLTSRFKGHVASDESISQH
jgi:hypothetical protein